MIQILAWALNLLFLGVTVFALIDAVRRPTAAFPAVERQTKTAWIVFLTLSLGLILVFPPVSWSFSFLGIIGVIVTMFYLVDVRPKVREITGSQ